MAAKFIVLAAFVAVASAVALVPEGEYDPNPQYSYSYSVQDPHTGDFKNQVESRSGDSVKGQYSLDDSDGTKRVVDYAADPITGFTAVVSKVPQTHGAAVAPVAYAAKPVAATNYVTPYSHVAKIASPYSYPGYGYHHPYGYPYHGLAHGYHGYPYNLGYHF